MATRTETKQHKGSQKQDEERSERNRSTQQRSEQAGAMQHSPQAQQPQQSQQQTGLSQRRQSMATVGSSPFSFMRRFGEGMDQLFSDFGLGGLMMPRGFSELAQWTPQVEMFQREGELVIRADLPGVNRSDIQVDLRDDAIVLRGERQDERHDEREGVYTTECIYGRFYREIPLPDGVDVDRASAVMRDGVLEIVMPLEEGQARGRRLEVQDAGQGEQQQGRQAEQQPGRQKAQAAGAGR